MAAHTQKLTATAQKNAEVEKHLDGGGMLLHVTKMDEDSAEGDAAIPMARISVTGKSARHAVLVRRTLRCAALAPGQQYADLPNLADHFRQSKVERTLGGREATYGYQRPYERICQPTSTSILLTDLPSLAYSVSDYKGVGDAAKLE